MNTNPQMEMWIPCIFFLFNVRSLLGVNVTVRVTDIDEACSDFLEKFEVSETWFSNVRSVKPNPIQIRVITHITCLVSRSELLCRNSAGIKHRGHFTDQWPDPVSHLHLTPRMNNAAPEKYVLIVSYFVKSKTVSKEVSLNQICHRSWPHRGSRSPQRTLHQSIIVPSPELTLLRLAMHNSHRYLPWQKISFLTHLHTLVSKIVKPESKSKHKRKASGRNNDSVDHVVIDIYW